MNLNDAQILAELHMEAHGLIAQGWRFAFDKAKRRFGFCSSKKIISMSAAIVELNTEHEVEQTILHEIAHALVGNHNNHNHIWHSKARELGYAGNRCYGPSVVKPERKVPDWVARHIAGLPQKVGRPARWNLVCDTCGSKTPRNNKTNTVRSCGKCSRRFNPAYVLRWEKNLND